MATAIYNSKSVPFGGLIVQLYRDQSNPVLVGNYILETISVAASDVLTKRPNELAGRNGWTLVEGDREGTCTLQIATATTPVPQGGWFFTASIRQDSSGVAVNERFVLSNVNTSAEMNGYRKITANVTVDADVS